jgi:putative ABC transport system permease protein
MMEATKEANHVSFSTGPQSCGREAAQAALAALAARSAALNEITQTLRDQHALAADGSADDFSVINQQDILDSVTQTTRTLTLLLGAIVAISLLVGGIGIMNIMLVSAR